MTNEQIATIVSKIVYSPKRNEKDPNFAVQLLVEKLCIPKDIEGYSEEDVKRNILWHLNSSDETYEMEEN